jgi:hypothetical protein
MICMDESGRTHFTHKMSGPSRYKVLGIVLVASLVAGVGTGFALASTQSGSPVAIITGTPDKAETAQQDTQTFKDFAEGKITKKPEAKPGTYAEGTHLLVRDGAVPVALTSSVVDLSLFEEKKVKVYGETQKAIKEGWLMDVGKVEEIN